MLLWKARQGTAPFPLSLAVMPYGNVSQQICMQLVNAAAISKITPQTSHGTPLFSVLQICAQRPTAAVDLADDLSSFTVKRGTHSCVPTMSTG